MAQADLPTPTRALIIRGAGILIILIGLGAFFLPELHPRDGARLVGAVMLAAGLAEMVAGIARRHEHVPAILAGLITSVAGVLLVVNPRGFLPVLNIVIVWLALRAGLLLFAAFQCRSFPRTWTLLAAGVDFALAFLLLAGLQISLLVVGIFGPSGPVVSTFAWVLAFSFFATGMLLLTVAGDAASDATHPLSSGAPAVGS